MAAARCEIAVSAKMAAAAMTSADRLPARRAMLRIAIQKCFRIRLWNSFW
jgi:hypothetical protein